MQVLIRFNGHITWNGRSNGLPETIYAFILMEDPDRALIIKMIEEQLSSFTRAQCMFVQREQGKPVDLRSQPAGRMAVPFHNISLIDIDVLPVAGEFSEADEDGVERLTNGEEPKKQ